MLTSRRDIPRLVTMPLKLGSDLNHVFLLSWPNVKHNLLPLKSVNNVVMDLMPRKLWVSKLHYTNCQYYIIHPLGNDFVLTFHDSTVWASFWVKMALCRIVHKKKKHIEAQSMLSSRGAKPTGHQCQGRKKPFRWKTCIQRRKRAIEKRTKTKPLTISCSYTIK